MECHKVSTALLLLLLFLYYLYLHGLHLLLSESAMSISICPLLMIIEPPSHWDWCVKVKCGGALSSDNFVFHFHSTSTLDAHIALLIVDGYSERNGRVCIDKHCGEKLAFFTFP